QLDAGFAAERLADEEIAIAVDEVRLHAGARDRTQTLDHAALVRIGIVIADPRFEQVAEDVQRLGATRLALQELEELRADVGPRAVEVQIRDEKRRHERGRRNPITSVPRS